jgi:chemotaxis protein MotB
MKKRIIIPLLVIASLTACVPAKKVEDIKNKKEICEEQRAALKEQNRKLDEQYTEAQDNLDELQRRHKALKQDTAVMGRSLRVMTKNYDKLNETYDLLLEKNKQLLQGNQKETQELFGDLKQSQTDLQKQTAALEEARRNLTEKENNLKELESELEKREARVNELKSILDHKDSTVNALRSKVSKALLGFENNGLTIEQKNGKVYVSLDESLLFKSGSYTVDSEGKKVLGKLGTVLEKNKDVNVMVEGHTDNVPYNGSGVIKDNWDLSVLRATSVLKIILDKSSVDPQRLIAAGRGEHLPIASNDNAEGRKKNRRTEIILTPKLDELFEILETN